MRRRSIINLLIALMVLLIQLRFTLEGAVLNAIVILCLLGVLLFIVIFVRKYNGVSIRNMPPVLLLFLAMINLSMIIRLALTEIGSVQFIGEVVLFNVPIWAALLVFSRDRFCSGEAVIEAIFTTLLVLCSLNVLLFLLGFYRDWSLQFVEDYSSGQALMLSYIGLDVERIGFYLSNGINSVGVTISLLIGAAYFSIRNIAFKTIGICLAVFCVLMIDSRSTVLYCAIAMLLAIYFGGGRQYKLLMICLLFIPFLPMAIAYLQLLLENSAIFGEVVSRGDSGALSGREVIWGLILFHFSEFDLMHVFGYGAMGQYASGVSGFLGSTEEFSNYANVEYLSAHNQYLQNLLNYGYVGLGFCLVVLVRCARAIRLMIQFGDRHVGFFIYFMAVLLMFSNTETPLIYPGQMYFAFCIVLVFSEMYLHRVRRN